jgi:hypothetical protein
MDTLEINVVSWKDKYRPMYRRRPTDRWCLIIRGGKPVECESSYQARKIGQEVIDLIAALENPVHLIEEEPELLGSLDEWRKQKDAALLAEKQRVFGTAPLRVIRDCKGNHVQVMTKGRARA